MWEPKVIRGVGVVGGVGCTNGLGSFDDRGTTRADEHNTLRRQRVHHHCPLRVLDGGYADALVKSHCEDARGMGQKGHSANGCGVQL